jgi:sugar-specific transcriptional regulator TrmB
VSHRHKCPLARTKEYEKEKITKYAELAMQNDARMMPFIIETNGGYGEQACNVVDDIKVFAHEEALAFATSEVVRDLMDAVAIAVQRGNAKAIIAAYERMMHVRYAQQVVSTAQMEQSMMVEIVNYDESEDGHDEMIRRSPTSQSLAAA